MDHRPAHRKGDFRRVFDPDDHARNAAERPKNDIWVRPRGRRPRRTPHDFTRRRNSWLLELFGLFPRRFPDYRFPYQCFWRALGDPAEFRPGNIQYSLAAGSARTE